MADAYRLAMATWNKQNTQIQYACTCAHTHTHTPLSSMLLIASAGLVTGVKRLTTLSHLSNDSIGHVHATEKKIKHMIITYFTEKIISNYNIFVTS